VYTILPNKGP
jgi:hypothetical protein